MWRRSWLVVAGMLLLAPAGWANRLHNFVYDVPQNRVEFRLSADTEPKGMVLFNPLRIVIDLPNVEYQGATIRRKVGDRLDSIRIGKSDVHTTRLVLEFAPQVQFDPTAVRLQTDNLGNWVLLLPPETATNVSGEGLMQPTVGTITDGFGYRVNPITGDRRLHKGIDIAAPMGTPIWAVADGTVLTVDYEGGGYGNFLEIRHDDGTVTLYAHAHRILVQKGQRVRRGEVIAEVGSTGRSSAPHLHFEVKPDGKNPVDPLTYVAIANHRIVINF